MPLCDEKNYCFTRSNFGFIGLYVINFLSKTTLSERLQFNQGPHPAGNYMLKVNNRNTRARREICSELTIKTLYC